MGSKISASGSPLGSTIATSEIDDDAATNAKLRNSAALSVIGRSANSTGDPADIVATAASGAVLRESGSVVGFGTVATVGLSDGAVTSPKVDATFLATLATLTGAQTLTSKAVALGSNTLSGTTAEFNTALSDNDFATLAGTEALTGKTLNLSSNTLTGTTAQFNTALSDGDFATVAGSESLTNKVLTTPTIASFVNATHSHQNAAGGGQITTAALSDYTNWTNVAYNAANFTAAASMTWGVDSGDQIVYRYKRTGDSVKIEVWINGSDVGGTASAALRVAIPNSYSPASAAACTGYISDAGVGVGAICSVTAAATYITINRFGAGLFTLTSSDNTSVNFLIEFPV